MRAGRSSAGEGAHRRSRPARPRLLPMLPMLLVLLFLSAGLSLAIGPAGLPAARAHQATLPNS